MSARRRSLRPGPHRDRGVQRFSQDDPGTGSWRGGRARDAEAVGLDAASVGSVVMGNVIRAGNKMNPARQASIGAHISASDPRAADLATTRRT
jgi:acetyl-CoA acetyltransferase